MKRFVLATIAVVCLFSESQAQKDATIKEFSKAFLTYPFSDPDPIPDPGKIRPYYLYPYYRFDGYTDKPVQKDWKVVELENDFIKVMILPEVGGKIWSAIEKSTGKSLIYYNHVIKFRDVSMRGPWTSGGIETDCGVLGHTPNVATPVDYTTIKKKDGSVSCVIGVLDLLTRSSWRIDINLPKDKAYFTTTFFWYNSSAFEQPYYSWMNAGIKAKGNLEFIFPGTTYLGHAGNYGDWPVNKKNGKEISFYDNNNFGGSKSYHVFGKYTDFFGGYWHDEDFGMGRYSTHDDKAGKKIWIWGLSPRGMLWEKLLTDSDGQYVELQSGRLFNQTLEQSTFTPFKHKGFLPHTTDTWTEYWFPVLQTKGFVAANNYGALNIKNENGWLKIYFSPLQNIQDELKITDDGKVVYSKKLSLKTLQLFVDSIQVKASQQLLVTLGVNKLRYENSPTANVLNRPVESPANFDWNSSYGLYVKGKENIHERLYSLAEENLKASLQKDSNYLPALTDFAMLLYRNTKYKEALAMARRALSIDTYDPAANYYYGIINNKLGNITDAKDGFDLASMEMDYRCASYTELAKIYFKENNFARAIDYANKSIDFNRYNIDAYQLLAVMYRLQNDRQHANKIIDTLLLYDPLNHFARFERYAAENSAQNKRQFIDLIRNEMPVQTFLELAIWYYNIGRNDEAKKILEFSPPNAEVSYWQAFLENKTLSTQNLDPKMTFPFRQETAEVLKSLIQHSDHWLLKYHLALMLWHYNDSTAAKDLFDQCGQQPDYAPFYAARSKLFMSNDTGKALKDIKYAANLDKNQWRYGKALINYYFEQKQPVNALAVATQYYTKFPQNYLIGMQYIKALLLNKQYSKADAAAQLINILPSEEARDYGKQLYKEIKLMLALEEMEKKNYKKALNYIAAARLWPENLGVGSPYESEVDERLEDWLTYQNNISLNNPQAAQKSLNKILSYTAFVNENFVPSANNLVSAWAMQKSGKAEQGEKFLEDAMLKDPNNPLGNWTTSEYKGAHVKLNDEKAGDENYRVLEKFIEVFTLK